MTQGGIAGTLQTLQDRWWSFFYRRCLVGFPWFWPARPPGVPAMVAARRMARRHFGRDHHPVYRALAQVLAAIAWPPAVLIHLWQIRHFRGPEAVPIKRVPGALWAAMRHNVLPGEYYAYALWQPDRKVNIDNYLYSNEAPRLFKLLNRPSQPNPIDDKLAFHEMCKAHALPSPEILAAFAPTGKLLEFESGRPPKRDLFVKPRIGVGGDGAERFRWQGVVFESDRGCRLRPEDLGGYLATRARTENRTLLVQPALSNHPELRVGANADLATARLVTGLSTDGDVIPIFGYFYLFCANRPNTGPASRADRRGERSTNVGAARVLARSGRTIGLIMVRMTSACCRTGILCCDTPKSRTRHAPTLSLLGGTRPSQSTDQCFSRAMRTGAADEYQRLRGEPLGHTKFADILATRLELASLTSSDPISLLERPYVPDRIS